MTEADFYRAVSSTTFSQRYYALCQRYPVRIPEPPLYNEPDVLQLLSELGRTPRRDRRERAYSFTRSLGADTLHLAFILKSGNQAEFLLWFEAGGQRIGGNFAVIAYRASEIARTPMPNPAYPRPEPHSMDDLKAVLTELFDLSEILMQIAERARHTS